VAFTSAATVPAWFGRAERLALGPADLRARVAAVGAATAEALSAHGVPVELVPGTFTTEALGRAFPRGTGRVLLPRADVAPPELQAALERKGWTPVRVEAYRTLRARALPGEAEEALREGRVDAITFTSASTVDGFITAAGTVRGPRVACIGPVTARAARAAGLRVHAVARPHTVAGLVEAVDRALR
jgi:uroporphyrinogen-III synthase